VEEAVSEEDRSVATRSVCGGITASGMHADYLFEGGICLKDMSIDVGLSGREREQGRERRRQGHKQRVINGNSEVVVGGDLL